MSEWFDSIKAQFVVNFIEKNRWRYLWEGLGNTLYITFFAVIIGIALGTIIAIVRSTADRNLSDMRPGPGRSILKFVDGVCRLYLTVIRGTPVVIQLMIFYYVIFASSRNSVLIAIISFGLNSAAYVAEVVRGGIMSVDIGQTEAGRSLGFNYVQTMWLIVVPQALKNVLPALAN